MSIQPISLLIATGRNVKVVEKKSTNIANVTNYTSFRYIFRVHDRHNKYVYVPICKKQTKNKMKSSSFVFCHNIQLGWHRDKQNSFYTLPTIFTHYFTWSSLRSLVLSRLDRITAVFFHILLQSLFKIAKCKWNCFHRAPIL